MALCALSLTACASHLPEPASEAGPAGGCRLPVVKLTANQFDDAEEGASRPLTGRSDEPATLIQSIASRTTVDRYGRPKSVLVLSGGSLHGAFGAGLFYGWMKSAQSGGEPIPEYDLITGVSTGALQSTFVFLESSSDEKIRQTATEKTEKDRLATAGFLSHRLGGQENGVDAAGSSYLANLAQDYMPDRESDLLHLYPLQKVSPNKAGMLELFGHQSVANMEPLRAVIEAELGPRTIEAVGAEAARGRKLFVAIADLVNRYGYAADLTKLAELATYPDRQSEQDLNRVFPDWQRGDRRNLIDAARQCYIDALVASSSVPPGVPSVSIEIIKEGRDGHILNPNPHHRGEPLPTVPSDRVAGQHAFVDGGATFAVFFTQLKSEITEAVNVNMDLIVNGDYYPKPWADFVKQPGYKRIRNVKMSAVDIGMQSADLLQTQVRLFSVQEARKWGQDHGRFRWAFIDNNGITAVEGGVDQFSHWRGPYAHTPQEWMFTSGGVPASCREWHKTDAAKFKPMEFYPTYMRCMLNYGMTRGADPSHRWNLCVPKDPSLCGRGEAGDFRKSRVDQRPSSSGELTSTPG